MVFTPGKPVTPGDLPAVVDFTELADETAFTSTSYIQGAAVTGVTFTAPTSGAVRVDWRARFQSNSNNTRAAVSVQVRTGGTIGAGTIVSDADDDSALETTQSATAGTTAAETRTQAGTWRRVSGLTAGTVYNAVVVHKMLSAGNATIFSRSIMVSPLT